MTNNLLVLGRATDPPIRALRWVVGPQGWSWAYLGVDFPRALEVACTVGSRAHRLPLGEELVRVTGVTARELVEALGRLRGEDDPLDWWTDSLSERNPYLSPLIRECALLRVVEKWLGGSGPLLLFIEGEALRAVICRMGRDQGWRVVDTARWPGHVRSVLRRSLRRVGAPTLFLMLGLLRLLQRRLSGRWGIDGSAQNPPDTLCFSFVGPEAFSGSPRATDPYWGPLLPWLQARGRRVAIVPVTVGRPLSPAQVASILAKRGAAVVLPEDHLRVRDYFWAAWHGVVAGWRPLRTVPFAGIDIRPLCAEERARHAGSLRLPLTLLHYRIGLRLAQGFNGLRACLYPFENQVWERALLLGLRRGCADLQIVGFQHSTIGPVEMNYFPGKSDWYDLPLPDRVVCHGKRFHEILEAAGYPSPRLVVGSSLRYAHLLEVPLPAGGSAGEATPTVLILLSIVLVEAAEVLWKSLQGLRGMTGVHVVVRPHPFMPLRNVLAKLGEPELTLGLEEDREPLERLLKRADCVIYRDTSAAFEAAAWGIPCVYVSSEVAVDNDPLDLLGPLEGLKRIASSPAEIRLAVEEILGVDSAVRETWQALGKRLRARTLTPIGSEGLNRFIPGFALGRTPKGSVPDGGGETLGL